MQSPADEDRVPPRTGRLGRYLLVAVLGVLVVGAAWIAVTAVLAKHQLSTAQSAAARARTLISDGDVAGATDAAATVARSAHAAHVYTTGPAWWIASEIPYLGRPLASVRICAASADTVGNDVLVPLARSVDGLRLSGLVNHGTVDIAPILSAAPVLARADLTLTHTAQDVDARPAHTWLPIVDSSTDRYARTVDALAAQVAGLDRAASVLPDMLGNSGTRRYFVGLENEAESRGLGGIPGAFAIVTADHGTLSFTRFESDTVLYNVRTGLDLGAEYARRYSGAAPWDTYPNSTISPDFRDAAQIWAAMWQKYSGQHIDGAVAVDPTAISYLLKVTGSAGLADGTQVTSGNVVALTQQTLYSKFPDTAQRKQYLIEIASAISHTVLSAHGSSSLIHAAARAASERRLVVWSASSTDEDVLRETSIAGTLEPEQAPFTGFTTTNATGGKQDFYLRRTMTYAGSGCGSVATRTATFAVTNDAPATGLPAYVTLREDKPAYPTKPGDDKLLISYYYPAGVAIRSVSVNGAPVTVVSTTEKGSEVFSLSVEIPRGTTSTIVVTSSGPSGPVTILRQPAVSPLSVSDTAAPC